MLDQLLPRRIDDTYRGSRVAPWIFGLVVLVKSLQMLMSIFDGYSIAQSADGLPLDTYTAAGAQTVVALFAVSGFSRLVLLLLCALVLVRYRSALPFMFVVLLVEQLGRTVILRFLPIVRTGTAGGMVVNQVLLGLMLVGVVLALWKRKTPLAVTSA